MPTIKTIMPAGGGDYISLQDWWNNWASQQATADQWAECYSGDCGFFSNYELPHVATPDSTHFFRIYAAEGESPFASYVGLENGTEHYSELEGLHLTNSYCFYCAFLVGVKLQQCRFEGLVEIQPAGTGVSLVDNNVFAGEDLYASLYIDAAAGDVLVYNNTLINKQGDNAFFALLVENMFGGTITVENNLIFGPNATGAMSLTGVTVVANNNITHDGTGDDYGGTGAQVNVDPEDVFTDFSSGDYSLKLASLAIDAGKTIPAISVDNVGTSRPQGVAFDIGAYEYPQAPPPPTGGPRWPTALARRNRFASPGRPAP